MAHAQVRLKHRADIASVAGDQDAHWLTDDLHGAPFTAPSALTRAAIALPANHTPTVPKLRRAMPFTDQHDRELAEDMWARMPQTTARHAALYEADPKGFFKSVERAIAIRDLSAIIASGRVLRDCDLLNRKPALKLSLASRLAGALIEHRHFEEAVAILLDPHNADADHPKSLHALARALAGAGRPEVALDAARRSVLARPEFEEGSELAQRLETLIDLQARTQNSPDWASIHRLTELYLELGMRDAAAALLRQALASAPVEARGAADEAVSVLERACDLLGPEAAIAVDLKVKPGTLALDRLEALRLRCSMRLGGQPSGAEAEEGRICLRFEQALALAASGEVGEAIERLGRLSVERRHDQDIRSALAYWIGRDVSSRIGVSLATSPDRRIFNLVPFNDELTMLELRLAEMAPWVDRFVIVEARHTFTGADKPLYFQEAKARFSAYADKLLHVVVDAPPPYVQAPWARDFHQRDMAIKALDGLASADDLVLLTDADEIVDHRALEGFEADFACLRMKLYRFFLNYRPSTNNQPERRTAAVFKANYVLRYGSSYARFALSRTTNLWPVVGHAGWHFTSMRDPAGIVAKVNSYAHQERPELWRDEGRVAEQLERIRRGEGEPGWERCEIDQSFPVAVRAREHELRDLIL
jgi:tetratricopeptide (TPR) repeat protein